MFCRYANQVIQKKIRENTYHASSRLRLWTKFGKLTLTELKGFLATIFNMGIIRKPTIAMYWVKRSSQSTIWFRKIFSRNRFQLILRFFHLVDNRKTPQRNSEHYNPAAWFKPLVDHANMQSKRYYTPNRELSIDESLVGTKARTVMTQYIPTKAHKFGIKLWMLVEATSGYIIHFLPYRGKRYDPVPADDTQGSHIVKKLMTEANLLNKNYHIFCDNFFTSIPLVRHLRTLRTYFTGTLRANRQMPQLLRNPQLRENESLFIRQRELMCVAYKERQNRKTVRFVTSAVKASAPAHGHKPVVSSIYSKNMGGVDLNDMMSGIYDDKRKTKTMWKRLAINIFHRMVLNAYIL
ncbi:piggyBac transposable element-derived protein 4-like [Mytilus californianus]|uniref:piggyBac transposable element-derived protein 4-like n=1 Tax=Mytilus californianus TaxID=6549 RepID=UPI002247884E|nr:piggyBac transposable element-derived protein 4-like [Mytilus californianus]